LPVSDVRQAVLSPTSINKTITRLAQVLELGVEYGLIDRNPAKGKRRRVRAAKPTPVWLDRAEHISALLKAADELDGQARRDRRHVLRRALVAVLVFAGLRISELLELRWRDVDLSDGGAHGCGRLHVGDSKTDAGRRRVDVLPVLQGILRSLPRGGPDDLVFGTSEGTRQGASNVRRRVLTPAVKRANERLIADEEVPLPAGITPHKLRHTFASVLVALGCDPGYVMDQLGHTNASFTLNVYRHGMRQDPVSRQVLRELVGADEWAATGSNVIPVEFSASAPTTAVEQTLLLAGDPGMGTAGLEPATSRV
jgi:integrase